MSGFLLFSGSAGGSSAVLPDAPTAWSTGCGTTQSTSWRAGLFAIKRNGFVVFVDHDTGEGFTEEDGYQVYTGTPTDRTPISLLSDFVNFGD